MVFFLYMCLDSVYISGIHGEQKRVSDILKLELQTVVCYPVDAENGTWETQTLTLNSFTFCIEFMHTSYILKVMSYNIFS